MCWVFVAVLRLSPGAAMGGFSLWLLLFFWSPGSRHAGFSNCSIQAQQLQLTIHLQDSSSSSQAENLSPLNVKPHLPSSQPLATHHSTFCLYNLASYKWNRTAIVLLWLVSFIEHNVLKVHSCCGTCLDFLPSQSQETSHWIFRLSSSINGHLDYFLVTFQPFHQQCMRVRFSLYPCHHLSSLILKKIILFICLLVVLGLRGCSGFSLAGASRGYSLVVQTSPCGGFSLWSMGSRAPEFQ